MNFLDHILQFIMQGGQTSTIAIMFIAIVGLIYDRVKMIKTMNDMTEKLSTIKDKERETVNAIIERYHQGNLNLIGALNEIKIVLLTLQQNRK